jgi:hypothetical protein
MRLEKINNTVEHTRKNEIYLEAIKNYVFKLDLIKRKYPNTLTGLFITRFLQFGKTCIANNCEFQKKQKLENISYLKETGNNVTSLFKHTNSNEPVSDTDKIEIQNSLCCALEIINHFNLQQLHTK